MTCWLIDTLAWTGALIALVLLLRRAVARHFGAQAAYALWLVPLARLFVPAITLPAWLDPREPVVAEPLGAVMLSPVEGAVHVAPIEAAPASIDLVPWLLAAWITGAIVFLALRFSAYFRLRSELLRDAVPVGNWGRVRLVETPATAAPLALGVIDKIVALPIGFMAQGDRTRRDLALDHELQHHQGHDLLANFAVQPLFALHWFNPLAWMGWRAMRRDQEAACDARVISRHGRESRAAYAEIIASFAAGPRASLAAPMACPVLGDKSIIHRLRSLTGGELSPRRRFAARALLAGGLASLPLTASISYAEAPLPPSPPAMLASVAPPAPTAPDAPLPPEAPAAPPAPRVSEAIEDHEHTMIMVEREMERAEQELERADREIERAVESIERQERRIVVDGRELPDSETRAHMAELQRELAKMRSELPDGRKLAVEIRRSVSEAMRSTPIVTEGCRGGSESVTTTTTENGRQVISICRVAIVRQAADGLRGARAAIARDPSLGEDERARALRELDRELRELETQE